MNNVDRKSNRGSQEILLLRTQNKQEKELETIEQEAFKPWGCCPRRTFYGIIDKINPPIEDDECRYQSH